MPKNVMLQKKNRNKKILICETRHLSYGSSCFFLQQIIAALKKRDIVVEYFKLEEDLSNIDALEIYAGRSFDAVLDINSYLPTMTMEDGSYFMDHIDAPFFNYIVDHPVHLHPLLNSRANHYYIICLDQEHRRYIQKMYPEIAGCFVLPLAGSVPPICKPYMERSWHIYFPGTYVPLTEYETKLKELESLEGFDSSLFHMAKEYCRGFTSGSHMPDMIEWFIEKQWETEYSAQQLHLNCRYIDRYVREAIRHQVLDALLAEGHSIHVTGAHWKYYDGKHQNSLIVHSECDYPSMLSCIGNSQIVLNIQPLFPNAPHDRILCAMAGGAVALTDSCDFLKENLKMGQHYLCYDVHRPNHSFQKLHKFLDNPNALCKIAEEGRRKACENYLWDHWTENFLGIIDNEIGTR